MDMYPTDQAVIASAKVMQEKEQHLRDVQAILQREGLLTSVNADTLFGTPYINIEYATAMVIHGIEVTWNAFIKGYMVKHLLDGRESSKIAWPRIESDAELVADYILNAIKTMKEIGR
jgi:hypothetical protein